MLNRKLLEGLIEQHGFVKAAHHIGVDPSHLWRIRKGLVSDSQKMVTKLMALGYEPNEILIREG